MYLGIHTKGDYLYNNDVRTIFLGVFNHIMGFYEYQQSRGMCCTKMMTIKDDQRDANINHLT